MCDASPRRTAAVSFTMCHCFPFLEVRDVVHRAGLVCQLWHKYFKSDALWERLFLRDTPPMVYAALEEVVANHLVDPVLAACAGIATMLQQSVEERWDAVKWQMLHPLRHHGLHATLAAAALASNLLSVVDIVQRAHHLDEALNVTVEVNAFSQCPALHCSAHSGNVNIVRYFLSLGLPVDTVTTYKYTALHIAASEGHLEVVRCLVEAHAD